MTTIGRVGQDLLTDKTKKNNNNKPKAEQETAQPTAARFNKVKREREKLPNTVKADRRMAHLPNGHELQTQIL